MADSEHEDDFPNDFDGLDFDGIPVLQAPTSSRHTPEITSPSAITPEIVPLPVASPVLSIRSNSIEDIDSSFLAAVDELEARALGDMARASGSSRSEPGGHPADAPDSNSLQGGKRKADPHQDIDIRAILAGYESELTCPICCDLLVGAQVANPCGHTCCGECGYGWLAQNKYEPTCAVCRTSLSSRKPLLPNFSADNLVRQHLQALARSGRPDWQEGGYRTIEWNKRLESWKKMADVGAAKEKAAAARLRRRQQRYYEVDEYWLVDDTANDDRGTSIPRATSRRSTRSRA